jgi:hypothetical protein
VKKSVGLVVLTKIPGYGGCPITHAVLQKRGFWNTEHQRAESYPGCTQVTCHGKLEDGEDFLVALGRELREELGETFAELILISGVSEVNNEITEEKMVRNFRATVSLSDLRKIRLHPDSGGLLLVTADQLEDFVPITSQMKNTGPEYFHSVAMFKDEIQAVKMALEMSDDK